MADAPTANAKPKWYVTGQSVGMEQGGTGQFVKGMNIQFATRSGLHSSVFLPDEKYASADAPQLIAAAIDAKAAQMEQISALQG